ncbi:MAG: hypothetical protein J3K34DRAFT_244898 [Monoraphidium minutum]|nr:MAG: hypothetical protein J3K34DRAFT_244898 [Monoraphidium minutum]
MHGALGSAPPPGAPNQSKPRSNPLHPQEGGAASRSGGQRHQSSKAGCCIWGTTQHKGRERGRGASEAFGGARGPGRPGAARKGRGGRAGRGGWAGRHRAAPNRRARGGRPPRRPPAGRQRPPSPAAHAGRAGGSVLMKCRPSLKNKAHQFSSGVH